MNKVFSMDGERAVFPHHVRSNGSSSSPIVIAAPSRLTRQVGKEVIVMAAYNGARHIVEQIGSIQSQTYSD